MAITLTQIRAFLAVRSTGSVHAAAVQLLISQPSVSAAVAALSGEIGTALFERHGRGVRLTPAGEAFAPYASEVLGLLEQGRNAAQEAAHPERSKIRLVAVNTAGEYLVPPLIQAYRQRHPEVSILLEVGNRATVVERLESRRADIGIGGRPPGRTLIGYPFVGNDLLVVARQTPADLAHTPWLMREEGSGTRLATERLLADLGISEGGDSTPEMLTLGSNGAVKQGLAIGLGVTLISRFAVARELREGALTEISVPGTPLSRPWHVLFPQAGLIRPAARTFGEFLQSEACRRIIENLL
ncbi:MAG TPA: LysR substrate-binding domain-containing protein [Streptosporangiaceae bacterium]|nr:LysR substrate-binding domain-containing protein [Streptosporangiaceae bacterium]